MTLTPQQERELYESMMIGLIRALCRTQHLTQAQADDLLSDPALWNR